MRKFTITATLCVMFGLLAVGQAFGTGEDCLETAAVWKDCVSAPGDTTIDKVTYKKITTKKELAWLSVNYGNNAILLNDLDMGGKLWIPIAAGDGSSRKYQKIFRGNGHVIKNIYINTTELASIDKSYQQNVGFIGVLAGGKVYDLILEEVDIQASTSIGDVIEQTETTAEDHQISVGAIVGWMNENDNNKIENCMVTGTIKTTGKGQGVGGIVGNAKKGTITSCMSLVEIQASGSDAYVGGIIGMSKNSITVSSCVYAGPGLSNTGENGLTGGISGNVYSGTLTATNNYFEGDDIDGVGGSICSKSCNPAASIPQNENATINVDISNEENVACTLNGKNNDGSCKTGVWDVGETGLSLNGYGKDGYKIVFNANGGAFANGKNTTNKFLQAGMTISGDELEKPTLTDNFFAGWALTSNAAEASPNLGTVSKVDTVYAVWKPVYTITFNVAPGSFSADEDDDERSKSVVAGERITVEGIGSLPEKFCSDKDDHGCNKYLYFTGWTLDEGKILDEDELPENYDPEDYTIDLTSISANGNKTFYAVWTEVETYTVTFNANEHGKTKVDYVKVGRNETTTAPAEPEPQEGYAFGGWFTIDDPQNSFNFNTKITQNLVLYAKWTPEPYTISYVMNGHSSQGDNETSYNVETETFSLIPPADVDGYVFEGWFKDAELTDKATQVTQGSTGNKTFFAKWSVKTYKISYLPDHNDTYGSASDQTKIHGTSITLLSSGKFWRYGYEQTGWATVAEGEKIYDFGASYEDNAALTLYPTWSDPIEYTITYVCEGCINDPDNRYSYTIETPTFSVKFKNLTRPDGYEMVGWYSATDYKTKVEQIYQGSFGNITLYAKLNKIYTITYVGTDKPNSAKTYTVDKAVTLGKPTRAGYTFAGWYDNANFEGDAVTKIEKGTTGDKTFYAKWIQKYGAITIVDNLDGTNSAVIDGDYTGTEAVEITSDIAVNSVTLDRTFTKNVLSSLFLPFSISTSQISGATKIYKFNRVAQNDEGIWKVKVSAVTELTANTPYMVLPSADGKLTFNIDDPVVFNTTTGPETHSVIKDTWEFKGVYAHLDFDENFPDVTRVYGFAAQAADGYNAGDFVKVGIGADIPAMRAYLVHHSAPLQKSSAGVLGQSVIPDVIEIEIEDENGIVVQTGKLNTVTGEVRMDRWFDLKGRKLNSKPTVKGTYYKNGKRVIVK